MSSTTDPHAFENVSGFAITAGAVAPEDEHLCGVCGQPREAAVHVARLPPPPPRAEARDPVQDGDPTPC